jgi:3'-phosphoadenosine 5'-phosphosulfate sulfotransferase (PAPS reductase)/FAD synthetase
MQITTRPHGGKNFRPRKNKQRIYTPEQLRNLQALSLNDKVAWSKDVIMKALGTITNPSCAFSAGKDSTVLLHLLLQYRPDIHVIYGNTGIEFPECVKFARFLKKEWNLNFHEAKPQINFWQIVKEYGWPLRGKGYGVSGVAHKTSREKFFARLEAEGKLSKQYQIQKDNPISSACCTFLKERPSEKIQKKLGVDGVFLGTMAAESRRRMFLTLDFGEFYRVKSNKMWKCNPLAIWTDDDIWSYIRRYNVPYASLYDMGYINEEGRKVCHKRNGCMFCGMDIKFPDNHLSIMRRTHPKAWHVLMVKKGLGKILLDLRLSIDRQYDLFSGSMDLTEYLEIFPCAFDQI